MVVGKQGEVPHNISKLLVLLGDVVETTLALRRAVAIEVGRVDCVVAASVADTPNVFCLAAEHFGQFLNLLEHLSSERRRPFARGTDRGHFIGTGAEFSVLKD